MVGARGSVPHAAACERSPVPGVIAKDAVSLGDDMPALDIVEIGTIRFASFDMLLLNARLAADRPGEPDCAGRVRDLGELISGIDPGKPAEDHRRLGKAAAPAGSR